MSDSEHPRVRIRRRDAVAYVTIDEAPVFDGGLLREVIAGLREAQRDDGVRSIVLSVANGGFGPLARAGAEGGHVEPDDARDHLLVLLDAIAAGPKRVYGALAGDAVGAGVEILLACDAIYGAPASSVAFTEDAPTTPGSRAFERARDLAGESMARDLTGAGRLSATEAYAADLFDGILVGDLLEDVSVFARRESGLPRGRYHAVSGTSESE